MASHRLYTDCLDDDVPEERHQGIEAGLAWGRVADSTVVYRDYGISEGMQKGIDRALAEDRPVEYRNLRYYGANATSADFSGSRHGPSEGDLG